jgi:hypothetical protein
MKPDPVLVRLACVADPRGELYWFEKGNGSDFPFEVKRVFYIKSVPLFTSRGGHAHRWCHQLITPAVGRLRVRTDNGEIREEFVMCDSHFGLYVPPMVWCELEFSEDAMCLVLASEHFDEDDYIRKYDIFLREVKA